MDGGVENIKESIDDNKKSFMKFSQFIPKRVLTEDLRKKIICIEGTAVDDENPALLILEQSPFVEDRLKDIFSEESQLKNELINDVYGRYECVPTQSLRGVKTTFIHPASQDDIKKYETHPINIWLETPQLYRDVILPHISQLNLQWVYDILDKKSKDKILYENIDAVIGFTIIPHSSWDQEDVFELHVVTIVRRQGIKSLRDLTSDHLPLLKNIDSSVAKFIEETYGIYRSRLVAFINYHPSYYHLHIHFANLSCQDLDCKTENTHLLSEVIDNIELVPDYYQKANLSFTFNPLDSWICEKTHPHLVGISTSVN